MSIAAGDLNCYVTFREKVETKGEYGTEESYRDYDSCWGSFEGLSGSAYFEAQQANSEIQGTLRIRYREDIDVTMRVEIRGAEYDIEAVHPPDDSKEELHVMVKAKKS